METSSKLFELLWSILRWSAQFLRSVKITSLKDGQEVIVQMYNVCGTHSWRMKGDFILCHRYQHKYWPHSDIYFNDTDGSWSSNFIIYGPSIWENDEFEVLVVELNPETRILVDYFYKTSTQNGGQPIEMPKPPSGFKIFHHIKLKRVLIPNKAAIS